MILKGGSALILFYALDRYSEDSDYDSNTIIDADGNGNGYKATILRCCVLNQYRISPILVLRARRDAADAL